jgi:hypothetical protein
VSAKPLFAAVVRRGTKTSSRRQRLYRKVFGVLEASSRLIERPDQVEGRREMKTAPELIAQMFKSICGLRAERAQAEQGKRPPH